MDKFTILVISICSGALGLWMVDTPCTLPTNLFIGQFLMTMAGILIYRALHVEGKKNEQT